MEMNLMENVVLFANEKFCGFWCMSSLKRAVHNVLSNTQKYGLEDHPITISLTRFNDRVLLSVHNEGTPIPLAVRDRMFRARLRLGSVNLAKQDVGLPLVQSVAESHGGAVIVDSEDGRGTTFSLSLPIDCRPLVAVD